MVTLVEGMVILKGKQGACFDILTASVTEVQDKRRDSQHWQLSEATEQPELEGSRKDIAASEDSGKAAEASGNGA